MIEFQYRLELSLKPRPTTTPNSAIRHQVQDETLVTGANELGGGGKAYTSFLYPSFKNCDLVPGAQVEVFSHKKVQEFMIKTGMKEADPIQTYDHTPHQMRLKDGDCFDEEQRSNQFGEHIQRINYYTSPELLMRIHTSCSQLVQETPNCFQVSGFNNIQYQDIKSSQLNTSRPLVVYGAKHPPIPSIFILEQIQEPLIGYQSHINLDDNIGFTFGKKCRKDEGQE
ncbi:hypothetical protein pb186bvf_013259 [Paramecium bursaria]